MANDRQVLRRRIRGVRETAKVTRAMELIASARMRRIEQRAIDARPYAERLNRLIGHVAGGARSHIESPLLYRFGVDRVMVVHMTTDRGLCGSLNTHLNHTLTQFLLEQKTPASVVTVGRKGRAYALRTRLNLVAEFSGLGDAPSIADLRPLCQLITDAFSRSEVDRVYVCYPEFVSAMVQRPRLEILLPVGRRLQTVEGAGYLYEPSPEVVLEALVVRYVEASIYHAYLELVASEYSARMVAMHSATDSALELAEDMTMALNKSRQSSVTEEICDVSAGAEAFAVGGRDG